ncbi:Puf family RNA-binding protein [Scheffersomyces coipomensis]|uniref:Puf family RNA-binding protein n=1 Tax=Scheffersomyces coipomensis TaxID=1788519 RepID=UPI00315CEA20
MVTKVNGVKRAAPAQSSKGNNAKKSKVVKKLPSPPPESEEEEEESEDEDLSSDEDIEASSEDELDELDDDEEEEEKDELDDLDNDDEDKVDEDKDSDDEDDDDEEDKDKVVDPNKKSSKEQHAEQRKVLAERKLQRKSGVEVQQIKNLWEKLRITKPTPPKQVRDKLCDEVWELSKDVILDLVLKHDASRVVQTLIKYSSKERRAKIIDSLKGNFYQLATSSYGKYLLVKLLHYGSKESRGKILDELHGKLRKLMRHKEGAYVAEDLYVLYSTAEQRHQIIREFWGAEYAVFRDSGKGKNVLEVTKESSEKKQLIMTNLFGTIKASVEKGSTGFQILHAAMKEYVSILEDNVELHDTQIRDFIDLLEEQFAELVHTQEGAEVASALIALANAKERKVIIRSLKSHTEELIKNEHGNLVLITLFLTVDDTVLVHKSFGQEIFTKELTPKLIQDKFSRRPLIYLLKGLDGRYFSPSVKKALTKYEELAYKKTSKKPQEQRRQELVTKALPLIYKSILSNESSEEFSLDKILSNNFVSQFLSELILTPTDNEEINEKYRPELVDAIFDKTIKGDIREDYHLVNKGPFITRLLKAIIQGSEYKWNPESKSLQVNANIAKIPATGTEFAVKVADEIIEKLKDWTTGQGAFVVISVFEVLQISSEAATFKKFKKELSKYKNLLAADKDNKGGQLLLTLLK